MSDPSENESDQSIFIVHTLGSDSDTLNDVCEDDSFAYAEHDNLDFCTTLYDSEDHNRAVGSSGVSC